MRLSLCVGNYGTTPYVIVGLGISVYCAEELCYSLKENAFLLDVTLMSDVLVDWLGDECGLKELARELYPLVHKKGTLSAFVTTIQTYVGLYDQQTIAEIEQVLKKGAGLSNHEKRKGQVDYLVKKGKYIAALRGYNVLLSQWDEYDSSHNFTPMPSLKADILYNKGVAFVHMMLYNHAAKYFHMAYELVEDKEYLIAYLAAKRIELNDQEYIAFAADLTEHGDTLIELEKRMNNVKQEYENHDQYKLLLERRKWRDGGQKQKYYDENESLTRALEEKYRNSVSD